MISRKAFRIFTGAIILTAVLYGGLVVLQVFRWKTSHWFFHYLADQIVHTKKLDPEKKHIVFLWVDHYEPGKGTRGTKFNKYWLKKFKKISLKHKDSYENHFKYTWFYPYDHKNDSVLIALNQMAFDGFGEIEIHWHHPRMNSAQFEVALHHALQWYHQYGVSLVYMKDTLFSRFGFIHGNWVLDNSGPQCGVNREIGILFRSGCYADFTFSTIETSAQPSLINSIYYVVDDPLPKSYETGIPVSTDTVYNRFMIFQGPIGFYFSNLSFEYGAVEAFALGTKRRVDKWIRSNIHVKGQPDWIFVKVFSHGAQSHAQVLEKNMDEVLTSHTIWNCIM